MEVADLSGFVVGGAVMVSSDSGGVQLAKDTVVGIDRAARRLQLSRRLERNALQVPPVAASCCTLRPPRACQLLRDAMQTNGATAANAFALLTAIGDRRPLRAVLPNSRFFLSHWETAREITQMCFQMCFPLPFQYNLGGEGR